MQTIDTTVGTQIYNICNVPPQSHRAFNQKLHKCCYMLSTVIDWNARSPCTYICCNIEPLTADIEFVLFGCFTAGLSTHTHTLTHIHIPTRKASHRKTLTHIYISMHTHTHSHWSVLRPAMFHFSLRFGRLAGNNENTTHNAWPDGIKFTAAWPNLVNSAVHALCCTGAMCMLGRKLAQGCTCALPPSNWVPTKHVFVSSLHFGAKGLLFYHQKAIYKC